MPTDVAFKTLKESLEDPGDLFLLTDFGKFDRPGQLHVAFQAMHQFKKDHGRLPKPWSNADAEAFKTIADKLNKESKNPVELDAALIEQFAKICAGDLSPMAASMGGIVAQEVMKACSGKFMPIKQWLYFDALECLPEDKSVLTEESCKPTGSRYDGQVAVFGQEFQQKMIKQKYFVVGAGAIGCELLKNLVLSGFKNIVIMCGAGISTNAGIPDFRSPSAGKRKAQFAIHAHHPHQTSFYQACTSS